MPFVCIYLRVTRLTSGKQNCSRSCSFGFGHNACCIHAGDYRKFAIALPTACPRNRQPSQTSQVNSVQYKLTHAYRREQIATRSKCHPSLVGNHLSLVNRSSTSQFRTVVFRKVDLYLPYQSAGSTMAGTLRIPSIGTVERCRLAVPRSCHLTSLLGNLGGHSRIAPQIFKLTVLVSATTSNYLVK